MPRSPRQAREIGIEMIHQDLALAHHQSAAANMFLGREFTKRPLAFLPLRVLDHKRMTAEARKDKFGVVADLMSVEHAESLLRETVAIAEPAPNLADREARDGHLFQVGAVGDRCHPTRRHPTRRYPSRR